MDTNPPTTIEEKQPAVAVEETMTVVVMYRNNWFGGDGWTYYRMTVTISAHCPTCGKRRGEPTWYHFCEDGEWFDVNQWVNPCQHKDTYHTAILEHRAREERKEVKS